MKQKSMKKSQILLSAFVLTSLIATGCCWDKGIQSRKNKNSGNNNQNKNTCQGLDWCMGPIIATNGNLKGESNIICNEKPCLSSNKVKHAQDTESEFIYGIWNSWHNRSDRKSHKIGSYNNPIIGRIEDELGVRFSDVPVPCFTEFDRQAGEQSVRDNLDYIHR